MQWNARSAISDKLSLNNFLISHQIDIALISETWFKTNQSIAFNGYHVVRKDRFDGKAGITILVSRKFNINPIVLQNNFNEDILACNVVIRLDKAYMSCLSIYRPPNVASSTDDWINIFKQVKPLFIIGGDFNGHNHGRGRVYLAT